MLSMISLPGGWEWFIIGFIAILLFGKRLPGIANAVGSSISEFKRGLSSVKKEVNEVADTLEDVSA